MRHAVQLSGIGLVLIIIAFTGCAATKHAATSGTNGNANASPAAMATPNVAGQWEGIWQRTGVGGIWSMALEQRGSKISGTRAGSGYSHAGRIEGELLGRRLHLTVNSGTVLTADLTVSEDGTTMSGHMFGVDRNWVQLKRIR
jgi:hypothetical protein